MQIIDLTSAEHVSVKSNIIPEFVGVKTNERIELSQLEVGIIIGKKSLMLGGVFCQPGIVHPGWKGVLEPFFIVYGKWHISPGEKIAHLIIIPTSNNMYKNILNIRG